MDIADILIADDERNVREAFAAALESEGHGVRTARNGEEALAEFSRKTPDLVVLDVMMPKRDGFSTAMEIRRRDALVPIIFLTAKSAETDKVMGLGLGADDYVVKTCGLAEFLARVRAALRRASVSGGGGAADGKFEIGGCTVDLRRLVLARPDGGTEALSVREIGLLKALSERPGEVVGRDELLDKVWGVRYGGTTRTLDTHVARVRGKLGAGGVTIETVRGAGYRYAPMATPAAKPAGKPAGKCKSSKRR